ncbi:hypothetical protein MKZ38_004415 [Zalerion maritima]|uniref:Uncharacterized protein n=1 Tax=Zalerion maritima TaxID=339359 RepID=A0AAD5RM21_9PEZI|nr:hypothetical protein MKZ38_004415 [Zalerion maritima]
MSKRTAPHPSLKVVVSISSLRSPPFLSHANLSFDPEFPIKDASDIQLSVHTTTCLSPHTNLSLRVLALLKVLPTTSAVHNNTSAPSIAGEDYVTRSGHHLIPHQLSANIIVSRNDETYTVNFLEKTKDGNKVLYRHDGGGDGSLNTCGPSTLHVPEHSWASPKVEDCLPIKWAAQESTAEQKPKIKFVWDLQPSANDDGKRDYARWLPLASYGSCAFVVFPVPTTEEEEDEFEMGDSESEQEGGCTDVGRALGLGIASCYFIGT